MKKTTNLTMDGIVYRVTLEVDANETRNRTWLTVSRGIINVTIATFNWLDGSIGGYANATIEHDWNVKELVYVAGDYNGCHNIKDCRQRLLCEVMQGLAHDIAYGHSVTHSNTAMKCAGVMGMLLNR